jgi:hypothetical protein
VGSPAYAYALPSLRSLQVFTDLRIVGRLAAPTSQPRSIPWQRSTKPCPQCSRLRAGT